MSAISIHIQQLNPTVTQAKIRDHTIAIDSPIARKGTDSGPTSRELFLASLGGCFMKNLQAMMHSRDKFVEGVTVEVIGTMADHPKRIAAVELVVSVPPNPHEADFERLVMVAERGCIISNTIRGAVDISVSIKTDQTITL